MTISNEYRISRRVLLGGATAALATSNLPMRAVAAGGSAANSRLRIASIGVGSRGGQLLQSLLKLRSQGVPIEIAAVCDVYQERRDQAAYVVRAAGMEPNVCVDYRELLADETIDAVCVATPHHWHARIALDALAAGKHIYCEKPMARTVDEALAVLRTWQASNLVMQVGVQCSALPVWKVVNEWLREGRLGKVVQFQTEYFRNSMAGQAREYSMTPQMTPATVDWRRFLGVDEGLAEDMPFDREKFAQWRRYWTFSSGLYADLFVHRVTAMLLATGLRFPARIVGAGGIFFELDGRQVPDMATVVADFDEGVQGLVTSTMNSCETPIKQLIRGHLGSIVFGNGEDFDGFDFVPERPQVTLDSSLKPQRVPTGQVPDTTLAHLHNFVDSVATNNRLAVNCSPEIGAAAVVNVRLACESYRQGKVFHFDPQSLQVSDGDASWAARCEEQSIARSKPSHIPGWTAGDKGSLLDPPADTALAGAWIDGVDPASKAEEGSGV